MLYFGLCYAVNQFERHFFDQNQQNKKANQIPTFLYPNPPKKKKIVLFTINTDWQNKELICPCIKIKNPIKSKKMPFCFSTFFWNFIFLCLMCANNTINNFYIPYTLKSPQNVFFWIFTQFEDFKSKSCQNLENYDFLDVIRNFWKNSVPYVCRSYIFCGCVLILY